jgi:hypothetical protein
LAYDTTATTTLEGKTGVSSLDGHTINRGHDGSVTVEGPGIVTARIPKSGDFDENLAEDMGSSDRKLLAMRLVEFSEVDITSRKDWEEREKRAMEMLGLKDTPPGGDDEQEDGHDVTHPMLMEATVRFQANAIVELFPPQGPAETKVLGTQSQAKMARAKRVRTFLNHYLVDVDDGYFNDTDKMCMYLPMGGSAFRRASQDFTTGLPILRHVKATNFIAPYAGTDLKSMPRYAWKFTMTGEDIDRAMQIKMFMDIYLPQPAQGLAMHAPSADQSDLRQPTYHEKDRLYPMLEYHIDLEVDCDEKGAGSPKLKDGDTGLRPYIVILDTANEQVLMVRRNWREKDKEHKKRIWFAHHQFLPGLGFYGWGYPHVIGSLGLAASGAVNALLDSALAANFQGGFVSKEAKIAGEFRLEHGVWKQCDSSGEDLAKSFYTPPFKEPSPALFQLLNILVEGGQRFAGTTDSAVGDGNNTGPVGTTVALIEQAQKPISAIHKRLHVSMSQELTMLCELIEDFMPDRYDYKIGDDEQFLLKSDFAPGVDVVCVTDPGVASDTQRVMRAQAVLELQEKAPDLYPPEHRAEAHRRMLVALKVPNIDAIGPKAKTPQYLDAVSENSNIFAGLPVRVFPYQDDQAHIAIHQDAIGRAQALFPPQVFENVIQPAMMAHIRDHMAKSYLKQIMQAAGIQPQFNQDGEPVGLDPHTEQTITSRVAAVLPQLPHPQPKPGTPSAQQQQEQAASQAKIANMQAESKAKLDNDEQEFQAKERRLQEAFDNEERRKDQAMAFQETRLTNTAVAKTVHTAATEHQKLAHKEAGHVQDLTQEEQAHEHQLRREHEAHQLGLAHQDDDHTQGLEHGDEAHDRDLKRGDEAHAQDLEHGEETHGQQLEHGAESHDQELEQGGEAHAQDLEQGAEAHGQSLEEGAQAHKQSMDQSEATSNQKLDQADKLAAQEEAHADSHMGGSVK